MKKGFTKSLVLICVLTTMSASTAFATVTRSIEYQQKQNVEQIRQQNDALKQQNSYLMQQNEILRQQTEALKQSQVNVHPIQNYTTAPVVTPIYTQSAVYYSAPAPVYYPPATVYSPGPWYGGLAAGYMLGHWSSPRWGHGCCHWR